MNNLPLYLKSILLTGCFYFMSFSSSAQNWEAEVVRSINSQNGNSDVWKYVNKSAKPLSVGIPATMLATGLLTKNKKLQHKSLEMIGGLAITIATTEGLKQLVNRPRPYQRYTGIYPDEYIDGKSFPSGHTSVAFFTAASLSMHHPKWYVIAPAFTWAAGVGYARLYYGQHSPTDLISSAIIGCGSAYAAHELHKLIYRKSKTVKLP